MSVRKGERGEGKLQVLNKARELKKHSLGLVRSEKNFPKSTRWLYAQGTARESLVSWLANAARGDTYHEQRKMIKFYKDTEEKFETNN